MSERRFPNLEWSWRMPLKRIAWKTAWWLMTRITMRGYTRHQQARMIDDALGAYRPMVFPYPYVQNTSGSGSVTVRWKRP